MDLVRSALRRLLVLHNDDIQKAFEHLCCTSLEPPRQNKTHFPPALLRSLLERGANVHAHHGLALRDAAETGNVDAVRLLIEHGANATVRNDAALFAASFAGHEEIVRLLLQNEALNIGFALVQACKGGHLGIVQLLCKLGAQNSCYRDSAFQAACSRGSLDLVRYLIQEGANIHADNDQAILVAGLRNQEGVMRFLIDQGVDVNAQSGYALNCAVCYGHESLVRFLIEKGANVHAVSKYNVKEALWKGHKSVIQILVEAGADLGYRGDAASQSLDHAGGDKDLGLRLDGGEDLEAEFDDDDGSGEY